MTRIISLTLALIFTLACMPNKAQAQNPVFGQAVSSFITVNQASDLTPNDDFVVAAITFDLTAVNFDVYLSLAPQASVRYLIVDSNSNQAVALTLAVSLERVSGGSQTGNSIRLSDGQTARFRLNVNFQTRDAGQYRLAIESLTVNVDAVNGQTFTLLTTPQGEWQTNAQFLNGNPAVPEPGSVVIIAFAALSIVGLRVRRRR